MISVISLTMNVHKIWKDLHSQISKYYFTKLKIIIKKFEVNNKIFHYYAPDISNVLYVLWTWTKKYECKFWHRAYSFIYQHKLSYNALHTIVLVTLLILLVPWAEIFIHCSQLLTFNCLILLSKLIDSWRQFSWIIISSKNFLSTHSLSVRSVMQQISHKAFLSVSA